MIFWLRFALCSCLRRRRRTIITLAGISFGIATLVVLGAIMVGVNDTMINNAVAIHTGNIVVKGNSSLPMPKALALGSGIIAAIWPALVAGRRPISQVMRGL